MVGYVRLDEQVDADFGRARRRAFLRRVLARLRKGPVPNRLPCFEEAGRKLSASGGARRERKSVRLTDVVGSVGQCSEFDEPILPVRQSARTRWERVDWAFHRGEIPPPVELYGIGDSYFAFDGNHRVSVVRYHGLAWIDAEVTDFLASVPPERVSKMHAKLDPNTRSKCANRWRAKR
jgi:hypothetical protein